jgi:hypothetical protein
MERKNVADELVAALREAAAIAILKPWWRRWQAKDLRGMVLLINLAIPLEFKQN